MAEMKQIAGNWRAYESAAYRGEWGVETDDPAMVEAGDETVLYPSQPKHIADLLAAAPDMLEALKYARAHGFVDRVEAAIAKAEGRS